MQYKNCCAGAERVWPTSGARAQRGRMERGAAKRRGRGLGQRNTKIQFIACLTITFLINQWNKTYGKC